MLQFSPSHNFHFSKESAVQIKWIPAQKSGYSYIFHAITQCESYRYAVYIIQRRKMSSVPHQSTLLSFSHKHNNTVPYIEIKLYLKKE